MNAIESHFQPLIGLPCWNVKPGFGSYLTLEFGEPHLEIQEPRPAREGVSERVRKSLARRHVTTRGQWHLWIYCCRWSVITDGELVGDCALDSDSKEPIRRAAEELDGQKLIGVTIAATSGTCVFYFDLGSRLETVPYDDQSEQWLLYQPGGMVLTFRGDGLYSHQPGDTPRDQEIWRPLFTLVPGWSTEPPAPESSE
ncbi:MAG: hypothetical protein K0Q72_2872 [Armatimonadetes bacterium]|jgi:hypothetical protein|nr:hypothetical protein [Armatimonadota bacterium]